MAQNQNQLENFFHFSSKLLIILPIVIIFFALIFKFVLKVEDKRIEKILPTPSINIQTPDFMNFFKNNSSPSAKLNLVGPFVCLLNTPTSSMSAYIKNKKFFAKIRENEKTNNSLFIDDCLYTWEGGSYSGERICGLSQYLGVAESLLTMNLLDLGQILGGKGTELKNLMNTCKEEKIENDSIFTAPKNVLFKNRQK
ncbi:hypothetical protein HY357_00525 [Candidatus Roizmanbacteria bacterium]|nr:hypothetical protein [Candidatus Roizmanbacteria bacterium]